MLDRGTVRLSRLIGQRKALEIVMTGRKVTVQDAHNIKSCKKIRSKLLKKVDFPTFGLPTNAIFNIILKFI